ncbi:MAG: 4-hydroxy-tetrahydrodipicolinate reductase [Fibrobacterota bacterium]
MLKITVAGCMGRMGKNVMEAVNETEGVRVSGLTEAPGSEHIGREIDGQIIKDNMMEAASGSNVIIDFTLPISTMENLEAARVRRKGIVIATTGLSESDEKNIKKASEEIPVVYAPNMGIGINLLLKLVEESAKTLGLDFNIEVIEAHHNKKKDAPSGTALALAEAAAAGAGLDRREDAVYGREGFTGERKRNEIGIHAVRAGDIVGDHTVLFCSTGERIELKHQAHSRMVFANGAVRAAKFLSGHDTGLYNMRDVLGI